MKNGGESVRHQRDWGVRAAEPCAAAAPREAGVWENSLWPPHESGLSIPSCTGSFGARTQLVAVPSLPQMQRLSHGSVSNNTAGSRSVCGVFGADHVQESHV